MKRFLALVQKDIALTTKNYFFYVTLFFAVLMVLVINFIVPEDTSMDTRVFAVFHYQVDETIKDQYKAMGVDLLDDRESLLERLEDNIQSVGMVFKEPGQVEYILQGHENQKYRDLMAFNTEVMFGKYQSVEQVKTRSLKDFAKVEAPTFNKLLLPLFHVMEPALLGLFLIATMMFSEKEENTLTVYGTTPGSISSFILSKTVVMILLGLISLLLTSVFVLGLQANYFWLIVLTIVGSFMGSALGLLLASFFRNITGAMMWIIMVSMVLSLPFASYFAPSFTPAWMKLLPTYYMLFAYKEAAFPSGNTGIILQTLMITSLVGIAAYILALFNYKRTIKTL